MSPRRPRGERRFKWTQASIKKLTATDPRGERWTDLVVSGLTVTVFPDGRKNFALRYGPRNRRRFITLGPFDVLSVDDARNMAQDILAAYRLHGDDPALALRRSRAVPTFSTWVKDYIPQRELETPKSAKRDVAYLADAEEYFGDRVLDEIDFEAVQDAHQAIALERGTTTANRWLSAVRACFRAAVPRFEPVGDPTQGVKLFDERKGRRRPHILTDAELAAVIAEVGRLADPFMRGVLLRLIATGCRKREALGARWDEVRLDVGEWWISDTKSGEPQTVYLAEPVVSMLQSLPRIEGSPWVFPSNRNPERNHLTSIDNRWYQIREQAGVPDAVIHDLRRSFADRVKRAGGLQVASAALRHSSIEVTGSRYTPPDEDLVRDTVAQVAEVIKFPKANRGSRRTTERRTR